MKFAVNTVLATFSLPKLLSNIVFNLQIYDFWIQAMKYRASAFTAIFQINKCKFYPISD